MFEVTGSYWQKIILAGDNWPRSKSHGECERKRNVWKLRSVFVNHRNNRLRGDNGEIIIP